MAITDKTRKILWGRSGNQCAICSCTLIEDATSNDSEAIVGDEAHIVSKKPEGPRGNITIEVDHDSYQNLILLCRTHHKLIDDQPLTFTRDLLLQIKENHEKKIQETLNGAFPRQEMAIRVNSGHDLLKFATGVFGLKYTYDPPGNRDEQAALSEFLSYVGDGFDILEDLPVSSRLEMEFDATELITNLENVGYWVFAGTETLVMQDKNGKYPWKNFILLIVKSDNPEIINVSELLFSDKAGE